MILEKVKSKQNNINNIKKSFIDAFNKKNGRTIKKIMSLKPINDIVQALEEIDNIEIIKFVLFCSIEQKIGQIFSFISYDKKIEIIENSNHQLIKEIFNDIEIDDINEIINELPANLHKKILISISGEMRRKLIELLRYEKGEAGSIMNTTFTSLNENLNINQAIKKIKEYDEKIDINNIAYITDDEGKLTGKISIYDILLEDRNDVILKNIMQKSMIYVKEDEELEEVILLFQKYDRESIPVVNQDDILIGIIDDNDILSVIQEENTEDIYKMYGITTLDQPYFRTSTYKIYKSRILWLILLMIASTLTSVVLDSLNSWGATVTAGISTLILVPIIPVISGTSGNAGSQSAATIIRSLSIGEITNKDYFKILIKEFNVAVLISISLCVINFLRLLVYFAILPINDQNILNEIITKISPFFIVDGKIGFLYYVCVSLAVSLSLFISVLLSKIVGATLPILANRFNIDPTSMASPLLTTLIDTITTTLLFSIGTGIIMLLMV